MSKLLQLPLRPQQQTRIVHLHHELRRPAKHRLAVLLRPQAKLPRATVQVSAAGGVSQSLINLTTLMFDFDSLRAQLSTLPDNMKTSGIQTKSEKTSARLKG